MMGESRARGRGGASAARCPICGSPSEPALRPFCSKRCADVDLARWMSGVYVIPDGGADADEDGARLPGDGDDPAH